MPSDDPSQPHRRSRTQAQQITKLVNVGLQGGGAHGAFVWGVLDYLLEDGRLDLCGISGASAGAVNAVVVAHGVSTGGREGGRAALADFWRKVGEPSSYIGPHPFQLPLPLSYFSEVTPAFVIFDLLTRCWSPYQLNPLNINPLRSILEATVDFERLRTCPRTNLFLTATNVRSGKVHVFRTKEVSADVVLASACLPQVFQAVEIDGEAYWDGGFMGNPAIFPLIYDSPSQDVVIVHVNPLVRPDVPRTALEIENRMNEISFNASLISEMRAIAFVTRLIDQGRIPEGLMKRMLLHSIAADDVMQTLSAVSKMNTSWEFLTQLRDIGRKRAAQWIDDSFDRIGEESSTDIRSFL
ncbi:MAG: patatin-like phospholipase family protein [Hyphomicrobium sp.]|uniref:patatin-like phospholipase family protein n=1 Tax=Hyphomicrobium sp. CS1BSMeth3 TaxID=1892844 RepID=UPI0009F926D6|nr:patatin-like phospholipase family protein [Hyphomicrobium sp. CS1BSMeth3]MBN9280279.1 patatin-like phospholipase family protein [Hyphomicrobium sp.]